MTQKSTICRHLNNLAYIHDSCLIIKGMSQHRLFIGNSSCISIEFWQMTFKCALLIIDFKTELFCTYIRNALYGELCQLFYTRKIKTIYLWKKHRIASLHPVAQSSFTRNLLFDSRNNFGSFYNLIHLLFFFCRVENPLNVDRDGF